MSARMGLVVELAIGVVTGAVNLALSGITSTRPQSHGASRWAGASERKQLGRTARAEQAAGDGVVLGFLGRRLLQSPAEDNVLVLGVQRSGKTSAGGEPTLLALTGSGV